MRCHVGLPVDLKHKRLTHDITSKAVPMFFFIHFGVNIKYAPDHPIGWWYCTVIYNILYCLQIKCVLVLHLISAAYATAALGLMSKHLPYRQDSYHCEHCRRLELHAVVLSLTPTQSTVVYAIFWTEGFLFKKFVWNKTSIWLTKTFAFEIYESCLVQDWNNVCRTDIIFPKTTESFLIYTVIVGSNQTCSLY